MAASDDRHATPDEKEFGDGESVDLGRPTTGYRPTTSDTEKAVVSGKQKLDVHGLPLVPQPSDHAEDPLNWPLAVRWYIALLVASLAFFVQLSSNLISPSFVTLAEALDVSDQRASYSTTVYILSSGIFPLFYMPISNVYGRRPLYLVFTLVAIASALGTGAIQSYTGLILGRLFFGLGGSVSIAIGAATICDLFTVSERGLPMGIYALFISNGPHVAPIIGGYIALDIDWRWCFYIPGFILIFFWILLIFTFPETLFARSPSAIAALPVHENDTMRKVFIRRLFWRGKILKDRSVKPKDFVLPFRMMKYVSIIVPCLFISTVNTYASAMFSVTGSHLAKELYGFNSGQTGLLMGIPLTLGCQISEMITGWVSDKFIQADARRNGGRYRPEARLWLLPLTLFSQAGAVAYGFAVAQHKPWGVLAITMGIAGVGLQTAMTLTYTYTTDCYKPQAAEVGTVINVIRQVYAFNIGFYALPFGEKHGFDFSFGILDGVVNTVTFIPFMALLFYGERIRNWQGKVGEHEDL